MEVHTAANSIPSAVITVTCVYINYYSQRSAFEDGVMFTFLGKFGDVAEMAEIRLDRDRALPTLNGAAHPELLLERFVLGLSDALREKGKMVNVAHSMDVLTLAEAETVNQS
ncbi:unnamed protein product [Echinostoma caproni]|uniref:Transcriptional regulator n=1 Tax=Echinostoma caproni TaxID=27848 RepID=A0A183AHM2_9TREM|nr:unnamed protein product [Echinostoma caproni]